MAEVPHTAPPPYDEWERLTRFLESARLAFDRERTMWGSLGIHEPQHVRIAARGPHGSYNVALNQHIDAVDDAETLHAAVLVHSYALAESAAAERLGRDQRSLAGIEDWGAGLLHTTGRDWTDVKGGLAGAVEVAVVRNAFAHGVRQIDAAAAARLFAAGGPARTPGSRVTLAYAQLRGFRARLLSLLSAGGIRRQT